jgi:hypothetical protein
MTNHKIKAGFIMFFLVMLFGFNQSAIAEKTKIITLAEEIEMVVGESIDLQTIKVDKFKFVSLLGTHSAGPVAVEVLMAFTTEEALVTDPVPRSRTACNIGGGPDGGVVYCHYSKGNPLSLRILGPYLAVRLVNTSGSDITVSLKVFLSK